MLTDFVKLFLSLVGFASSALGMDTWLDYLRAYTCHVIFAKAHWCCVIAIEGIKIC